MKQYKLTSRDVFDITLDAAVPDAYIDPQDPILQQAKQQASNVVIDHMLGSLKDKGNGKES